MSLLTLETFSLAQEGVDVKEEIDNILVSYNNEQSRGEKHDELIDIFAKVYDIAQQYKYTENNDLDLDDQVDNSKSNENFNELNQCLNRLATLESTSHTQDANDLKTITLSYITSIVLLRTSKSLTDSTIQIMDAINYYDVTLSKDYRIMMYFLQTLPVNVFQFIKKVINVKDVGTMKNSLTVKDIPQWLPSFTIDAYLNISQFIKVGITLLNKATEEFFASPTSFLLEKRRTSKSMLNTFWNSTINLPYRYAKYDLEKKRRALNKIRKQNITRLGYLLLNPPVSFKNQNRFHAENYIVYNIPTLFKEAETFKLPDECAKDDSVPAQRKELQNIIKNVLPEFEKIISEKIKENKPPSYLTRNWPVILPLSLLALSYLPSTVRNVRSFMYDENVRRETFQYFRRLGDYVIDTTISFWNNWIINPINNILKTIRHDNNSEIALMSQQSLASDLKSLERMVIDYAKDVHHGDIKDIEEFANLIKSGDLTIIMNDYEAEMKTPIKSALTGEMLRNILIQIQKTKVDGALALNGVDKILKSQELVFGFVAASPSLFILWNLKNSFMSWYNGDNENKDKKQKSFDIGVRLCRSLGAVEKIITSWDIKNNKKKSNEIDVNTDDVDNTLEVYNQGLIFIQIKNIKNLASQIMPQYILKDFIKDVNDLHNVREYSELKLHTIDRIWKVYGRFFT